MRNVIISDTSCLVLLKNINQLELLQKVFSEITITEEVYSEFGNELPDWIKVVNTPTIEENLIRLLDLGEASSISFALNSKNSLLIIDEAKGRKAAKNLGINIIGTLGIFVLAKEKGLVQEVKPLLERVKTTNFRFSKSVEASILKMAGEE